MSPGSRSAAAGECRGSRPKAGLIAINVFERSGGARNSNILAALDWLIGVARTGRATIASVNMKPRAARHFAEPCPDRIYDLAAKLLARQNVALAAAGNESSRHGISHPACVRDIISVGAIDKRFRVAEFSNSAPILDMLAPGRRDSFVGAALGAREGAVQGVSRHVHGGAPCRGRVCLAAPGRAGPSAA